MSTFAIKRVNARELYVFGDFKSTHVLYYNTKRPRSSFDVP